jgi:caa(3)-type oxidase subunit IV
MAHHDAQHAHDEAHHTNYAKVYYTLLALLVVSVAGPFLEIQVVTLITAFGIAVVKAYLVAKHFMHINLTPRFVPYVVTTCLVFMFLFFAGTSPDVMQPSGDNWVKKPATWLYSPDPGAAHHAGGEHGAAGH